MVPVRPAERPDVPAVLALWARARSAAAVTPDTTEAVERLLATLPGSLLVAEHGPEPTIVGALVAAWDGWRGNMYRLAVDPAHRRRGIATALGQAQIAWAAARGYEELVTTTGVTNNALRRQKARLGYEERPGSVLVRGVVRSLARAPSAGA